MLMDTTTTTTGLAALGTAMVNLLAAALASLIIGAVLYATYAGIAWQFNLPTLGYWVCVGVTYTIKALFKK